MPYQAMKAEGTELEAVPGRATLPHLPVPSLRRWPGHSLGPSRRWHPTVRPARARPEQGQACIRRDVVETDPNAARREWLAAVQRDGAGREQDRGESGDGQGAAALDAVEIVGQ